MTLLPAPTLARCTSRGCSRAPIGPGHASCRDCLLRSLIAPVPPAAPDHFNPPVAPARREAREVLPALR